MVHRLNPKYRRQFQGTVTLMRRLGNWASVAGDNADMAMMTSPAPRDRTVRAKGASLKATEQPIDTSTAAGKCFLNMLGVFAETNLRRERQLEGIAKAKAAGVYMGRPASIGVTKVRRMKAQGLGASEIAKALNIGRASVYRSLGDRAYPRKPPSWSQP
jgi:DNA invertase Pin-like site-specific DNA recombinase